MGASWIGATFDTAAKHIDEHTRRVAVSEFTLAPNLLKPVSTPGEILKD